MENIRFFCSVRFLPILVKTGQKLPPQGPGGLPKASWMHWVLVKYQPKRSHGDQFQLNFNDFCNFSEIDCRSSREVFKKKASVNPCNNETPGARLRVRRSRGKALRATCHCKNCFFCFMHLVCNRSLYNLRLFLSNQIWFQLMYRGIESIFWRRALRTPSVLTLSRAVLHV